MSPVVKNELVTITPVTLLAEAPDGEGASGGSAAAAEGSNGAAAAAAEEGEEPQAKRARVEAGGEGGLDIASTPVESPAACYICELPDVPGKFMPQKVRACGCAHGWCAARGWARGVEGGQAGVGRCRQAW